MNIDDLNGLDEATRKEIEDLQKLTREIDGGEKFAKAQLQIGNIFASNENFVAAIEIWKKIISSDSEDKYIQAQYNIGMGSMLLNRNEEALSTFSSIQRVDSAEYYAKSQLNSGMILAGSKKLEEAVEAWHNVKYEDDKLSYAQAKWNIGWYFQIQEKEDKAVIEWRKIHYEDAPQEHYIAWGMTTDYFMKQEDYIEARKAFKEARQHYKSSVALKILNFKEESLISQSYGVFTLILQIVNELTIERKGDEEERYPERKLAHYTRTTTANLLLSYTNKNLPSSFRLNTISNVNDPSEGVLLSRFLEKDKDLLYPLPEFNEKFHAFVSCFTFNHDSLNQFRLYGKENDKEASGVSLVFRQSFFREQSFNWLSNEQLGIKESTHKIGRLPAMRCIYIDPINGYMHLAQRNKLTFFNEFENVKFAQEKWEEYRKFMEEKTDSVTKSLYTLKQNYTKLVKEINGNSDKKTIKEAKELLDEILLPLKYLVKHYAFQEEQECRMIYITSLDKPEVQMDFGRFLYVEYEADVKSNLDKIYIAPAATRYQPYLSPSQILCNCHLD